VLTAAPLPAGHESQPGGEKRRAASHGDNLNWTFTGPRRCTGVWTGAERRPCLAAASLPGGGTDPQCHACAAADRGRQLARDAILGDDDRTYQLYLAWFGPELLKVGLTAGDRGRDRLLEQGAIAFTLLAEGPYVPVRQAERIISAGHLARERIGAHAKAAAWWSLPGPDDRSALLLAAREHVMQQVTLSPQVRCLAPAVTDQAADFSLPIPFPRGYAEVTAIESSARLAGEIRSVIGRHLLLSSAGTLLLIDMRLAAGRVFLPHSLDAPGPNALQLAARTCPEEPDASQQRLF
jgi:hypothetical protein